MAKEQSPAFQFYPMDFLADSQVAAMTLQECGAYITLLCFCWRERSLPAEPEALARLCRVSTTAFARLWPALAPCFAVKDGRLVQPRLDRERRKQARYRQLQAESGRKGGRAKALATGKRASSEPLASLQPKRSDGGSDWLAKPSSSSSSSSLSSSLSSEVQKQKQKSNGGGKERPQFQNERFVVFRWQQEELISMLGAHVEAFELDDWLMTGAFRRAQQETAVVTDWWKWLKAETIREAQRRGLPMASVSAEPTNKRIVGLVAGGQAFLNRRQD